MGGAFSEILSCCKLGFNRCSCFRTTSVCSRRSCGRRNSFALMCCVEGGRSGLSSLVGRVIRRGGSVCGECRLGRVSIMCRAGNVCCVYRGKE